MLGEPAKHPEQSRPRDETQPVRGMETTPAIMQGACHSGNSSGHWALRWQTPQWTVARSPLDHRRWTRTDLKTTPPRNEPTKSAR